MLVQSMLQHMPVVLPANCDAFVVSRAGSACAEHVAAYKTEKWQYVNRTLQLWGFSLHCLAILDLDRGSQMWCVSGIFWAAL